MGAITLAYDAASRRTRSTLPNQLSTEYQYDLASQLIGLTYRSAIGVVGNLVYEYDEAGNPTGVGGSLARVLLPDAVATSVYDAANRQRQFGDIMINYDAEGNATGISDTVTATSLTWDARNRLIGWTTATSAASFTYDYGGRRIGKSMGPGSTSYLHDGLNITLVQISVESG